MYRRPNMKEVAQEARAIQLEKQKQLKKQTRTEKLAQSTNSRTLRDEHDRIRNITVGFRVSPEENELINAAVAVSGLPKQEYCYRRCLNQDVVVKGNPRVYKALKDQLGNVLIQLKRLVSLEEASPELLKTIDLIATVLGGMKEEKDKNENIF